MNDYRAYVENNYNSIYHHGVKGQKWGQRKYQNADGSLTPEGRQRYLTLNGQGRMRYGVANTAGIAIAGGTASGLALADAAINKNIGVYSKKMAEASMSKYYDKPLYRRLNRLSRRSLRKSKQCVGIALATAGLTTVAALANEARRRKVMNRLSGIDASNKKRLEKQKDKAE